MVSGRVLAAYEPAPALPHNVLIPTRQQKQEAYGGKSARQEQSHVRDLLGLSASMDARRAEAEGTDHMKVGDCVSLSVTRGLAAA
jgi:hypothetical protein